MAISTFANYKTALTSRAIHIEGYQQLAGNTASMLLRSSAKEQKTWGAYATPTTAVVPTASTFGSMPFPLGSGSSYRILQANFSVGSSDNYWILCDRLSHQGGLVANVNTTQTTNLPTAALTRFTSGDGVWAAIEIYTSIGNTGTTFTVSYTNQAGTSGQTSRAQVIGGGNDTQSGRFIIIPLADGDTGFRSIESVTLAATTGTAGNIGVTLFKPLYMMVSEFGTIVGSRASNNNSLLSGAQLEAIPANASLFLVDGFNASNGGGLFDLVIATDT